MAAFTCGGVFAADVKYPSADPSFSVSAPEGFQCTEGKSGALTCSVTGGFRVVIQPSKATSKDAKAAVAEVLEWQVKEAHAKDFKAGAVEEKNGKTIGRGECRFVPSDPADAPTPYALTAAVFEAGGKQFQLTNTTTPAEAAKRDAELKSMIDSIKPMSSSGETKATEQKTDKKDAADDGQEEEGTTGSGLGGGSKAKPSPSP